MKSPARLPIISSSSWLESSRCARKFIVVVRYFSPIVA
jgi:hypothetical protein